MCNPAGCAEMCASRDFLYRIKFWGYFCRSVNFSGSYLAPYWGGVGLDKWKLCEIYDLGTKLLPFSWLLSEGALFIEYVDSKKIINFLRIRWKMLSAVAIKWGGLCVCTQKNRWNFWKSVNFLPSDLPTYWGDHIKLSWRGCILVFSFGYLLRGYLHFPHACRGLMVKF